MENGHLWWIFPWKIVIFHSYVKLPEGNRKHHCLEGAHVTETRIASSAVVLLSNKALATMKDLAFRTIEMKFMRVIHGKANLKDMMMNHGEW